MGGSALDRQRNAPARSSPMFYAKAPAADPGCRKTQHRKFIVIIGLLLIMVDLDSVCAQSYRKEMDTSETVTLTVKSRSGRVSVIASDEQKKKVTIEASSSGAQVDPTDVHAAAKGNNVE